MRPSFVIALAAFLASGCASSRSTARERNPVVFVHGWSSSADAWSTMAERFRDDGWPEAYLVVWSYDTSRSNVETAGRLADRVDAVLEATGASRVDVVAHSMGALPARYYVRHLGGDARVDGWVSLGSPNHGTVTAYTCVSRSCREMRPGSSFMSALNEGDETPGDETPGTRPGAGALRDVAVAVRLRGGAAGQPGPGRGDQPDDGVPAPPRAADRRGRLRGGARLAGRQRGGA